MKVTSRLSKMIIKIPSKLEVAPPPKCGLGDGWMEWVIPLRLLRLLEHLAVLTKIKIIR